jgi:hypothetical protein
MRHAAIRLAALFGLVSLAGCSFTTQLHYEPTATDVQHPDTAVALTVIDGREPGYGGTDKTRIGTVRGGFGNPFPVYDTDAQTVSQLVQLATTDALVQSRVAVQSGSPRTLVVTVTKFWVDGYVGYGASVVAQCDLKDEHGIVLWSGTATGSGSGVRLWVPVSFVQPTFQKALANYVEQATGLFSSTDFQKHLY